MAPSEPWPAAPPPVVTEESLAFQTHGLSVGDEHHLLSGWARLFPASEESNGGERIWLTATDLKVHASAGMDSPPGGAAHLSADDIIALSTIEPSPPPSRRYRLTLTVQRWRGELPQSPRVSPPTPPSVLRRSSEQLLSLLSPLWRASRASLTFAVPSKLKRAAAVTGNRRVTGL